MMASISKHDGLISRRSIFIGAAASLLCAPAIVRAASLMPVRRLRGPIGPQYAGFCERLFYHSLDGNLRADRMSTVLNGKIIIEEDARRMVAYARAQGWLPPEVAGGDATGFAPALVAHDEEVTDAAKRISFLPA
jgi:hypothetical protein